MAIKTSCPNCQTSYNLPDTQAGKRVRCRQCQGTFVVAAEDEVPVLEEATAEEVRLWEARRRPAVEELPVLSGASSGALRREGPAGHTPLPGPRSRLDRDRDDYEDEPPRQGSSALLIVGVVAALLVLIGGAGGLAYWFSLPSTPDNQQAGGTHQGGGGPVNPNPNPFEQPKDGGNPAPRPVDPIPPVETNPRPTDVAGALAALKENNPERRKTAAEWLSTATLDEGRRAEVARALHPLLEENRTREAALSALERWWTRDSVDPLVKLLDDSNGNVVRSAAKVLGKTGDTRAVQPLAKMLTNFFNHGAAESALADLGKAAEKEVLPYLHHKDHFARTGAERLLRKYETPDATLLEQAVTDLESTETETRRRALETVSKKKPVAALQSRVAKALAERLTDSDFFLKREAAKALETWADKDTVPTLIDAVKDNQLRDSAIAALLQVKDERGLAALVLLLHTFQADQQTKIGKAAVAVGPNATLEKAAWAQLNNADPALRRLACEMLAAIGTKDSLAVLAKYRAAEVKFRQTFNVKLADAVIKKIQERVNKE